MKFHPAVLIALSSLLLLNITETSTYEPREILPSTGLWNYLPVFGIWARIVHFLAVDTNGLGSQVKTLDKYFKNKYTPEKYVDLVNHLVNKLPKFKIAFRLLKIKENLRNVRDPKTGKTLGDAFDIIHDIDNDDEAVNQIASRLNLVSPDSISMIESQPNADFDLRRTLKNIILENPSVIGDVLKDPQVVNFITSSILQYLASEQVVNGIESLQSLITILEIAHPNMFQEGQNPLTDLKDKKTGMSFIKTLETLVNIIENPAFPKELGKLLNNETMTYLHEKTQDVVSKVIDQPSKSLRKQREESISIDADENQAPEMTPEKFVHFLNNFNVKLDEQTAENLLQASKNNELGEKAHQFLTELTQMGDLTPAKVTQFVNEKGVGVDEKSVLDAINTITSLPPNTLAQLLNEIGLDIPEAQVTEMSQTIAKLKKKYDEDRASASSGQVQVSNSDEEDLTEGSETIPSQVDLVVEEDKENDDSVVEEDDKNDDLMVEEDKEKDDLVVEEDNEN